MSKNSQKEKEVFAVALEHAKKYGMEKDFIDAYKLYGDAMEALEEWDLITPEIIEKITSIKE